MVVKYPTEERIRSRAYQICLERGGQSGHDLDDRLQAEYELMQLPIRKLANVEMPKRMISLMSLIEATAFLEVGAPPYLN